MINKYILVACEESQRVTEAFRKEGFIAFSCDIEDETGGHPEWHIQQDVSTIINTPACFTTKDGMIHYIVNWDAIIAFPPCTYLTVVGNRAYSPRCNSPEKITKRIEARNRAIDFFMLLATAPCAHIAIENPVGYMNTHYKKPDQIIHPYMFGEPYTKRTCLWLKNLPKLTPTKILPKPDPVYICQGEKSAGKRIMWVEGIRGTHGGQKGRAAARSRTFKGIAAAMAKQWGKYLKEV